MNEIPSTLRAVYLCRVCGKGHFLKREAQACEASTEKPRAKVGDLVLIQKGFGWYDGDPAWVVEHGGYEFHGQKTHAFWYIVTSLQPVHRARPLIGEPDCHVPVYHLWTGALQRQETSGWTRVKTHYWQWKEDKRKPPEGLAQKGAHMLGKWSDRLL